jgi:hypothetical protein
MKPAPVGTKVRYKRERKNIHQWEIYDRDGHSFISGKPGNPAANAVCLVRSQTRVWTTWGWIEPWDEEPDAYERPGLPRPKHEWRGRHSSIDRCPELPDKLPVPWVNGPCVRDDDDWHSFRDDSIRIYHERLCVICGNKLGVRMLIPAQDGKRESSGGGAHPKCCLIAINRCPHLVEHANLGAISAWEYTGTDSGLLLEQSQIDYEEWGSFDEISPDAKPLTKDQVRAIAHADPWGERLT